jgi:hypothetical protein
LAARRVAGVNVRVCAIGLRHWFAPLCAIATKAMAHLKCAMLLSMANFLMAQNGFAPLVRH